MTLSARAGVVLITALLSACAIPAAQEAHRAPVSQLVEIDDCPATPEAAVALFANEVPVDQTRARSLTECPQPIARVYGLMRLADAPQMPEGILRTILVGLGDPAEIVRHEALISARKHQADVLPNLLSALEGEPALAASAAALIMTLDPALGRKSLANDPRWAPLLDGFTRQPGKQSYADKGSLVATNLAERDRAVVTNCFPDAMQLDAELPCFNAYPGANAYARLAMNERAAVSDTATFDRAIGVVRGVSPEDQRAIELMCQLGGLCNGVADQEAERQASDVGGVETRGLPSLGRLLTASKAGGTGAPGRDTRRRGIRPLAGFPRFPWPAPKPVQQEVISVAKLGGPGATFYTVARRLRNVLQDADPNFETSIFSGPPDGFVLMARMERIQPDGNPYPPDNRFTYLGNPSLGFLDAVRGLVAERPGYFRVIAFVITGDLQIDEKRSASSIPVDDIGGPSILPASVGSQKLGNRSVVALVYAFERRPGETQRPWTQGAPSALTHLRRSGIAGPLGL